MQFKELVQQPEFIEYRRREIERGADFLKQIWSNPDPQYIRGALEMLNKIIRLPESFSDAPETKAFMNTVVQRDMAEFETKFLRKHLADE